MAKSADAFRTISEVAEWLGVQTHVLRFWESKFSQVKPIKRAGGRRYYRPTDMLLLGGIRKLLHEDGLTIKGVQKVLREEGMAYVADMSPPLDDGTDAQLEADLAAPVHEEFAAPIQEDFAAPMHEDFAAPMHEDAPPAPIQAEVLPFDRDGAQSAAEETEDPFLPEQPDPAPVPETPGEEAALPSFMRSPMPKDAVDEEPG
ncbi:MAG: MerR family transcriptional regulator, partial [Pseudomonadota bacterium]